MAIYTIIRIYEMPAESLQQATYRMSEALQDISEGFFLPWMMADGWMFQGGVNADEILGTLDERQVEIRGKYVQKADGKRELWVGYIT